MRIIGRQVEGKTDSREAFVQFSIKLYDKQNKTHATFTCINTQQQKKNFTEIMFDGKTENIKLFANITQT